MAVTNNFFAEQLALWMEQANITQAELARRMQVSREQIRRLLNGDHKPREATMESLSIAVGVPLSVVRNAVHRLDDEIDYAADDVAPLVAYYNGLGADDQDELLEIARRKWERKRKAEIDAK